MKISVLQTADHFRNFVGENKNRPFPTYFDLPTPHSVEKKKKNYLPLTIKISSIQFAQCDLQVKRLRLLSRNFCHKIVRVKFCNFNTVHPLLQSRGPSH